MVPPEALLAISGSLISLLGGAGLKLAGMLITERRREGAWLFMAVFATLLAEMIGLGLFSVAGGPLAGPTSALAETLGD
jgi:glucose dehydrogenase